MGTLLKKDEEKCRELKLQLPEYPLVIYGLNRDRLQKLPTINKLAALIDQIHPIAGNSVSEDEVRERLSRVFPDYLPRSVLYEESNVWYRAVRCDTSTGHASLRRCIYPPEGSPYYQRASRPNTPVLYGAWNLMTALDELQPKVGEHFQVIAFNVQPKKNVICRLLGDVQRRFASDRCLFNDPPEGNYIESLAKSDPNRYLKILFLDSAFSDIFRRDKRETNEYVTSALIAEAMMRLGFPLLYPSVRIQHALNVAIPRATFDAAFQILFTQVHTITQSRRYGFIDSSPQRYSSTFSEEGIIDWSGKTRPSMTTRAFGRLTPKPGTEGWRVPLKA